MWLFVWALGGDDEAFLCSSSKMKKQEVAQEVNNVQNGADCEAWNHPHRFCWHRSGPAANGHGAHRTPRFHDANISPVRMTCGRISGLLPRHRSQNALWASCCSVARRARQKQPPPMGARAGLSDTDYSDSSCQELPVTTCLF